MLVFDTNVVRNVNGEIMMPVVENFLSLNGEGLESGKPSMFIRLQGCNLRCKYDDKTKLCDTPEGLAFPQKCSSKNYTYKTARELAKEILNVKVNRVCLTGGEPLAREGIAEFIKDLTLHLRHRSITIEIETNGSISLMDTFKYIDIPDSVVFTLDYKSKSSGERDKMNLLNWSLLRQKDAIKFVVSNREEMEEAVELLKQLQPKAQPIFSPMFNKISLQEMWEFIYSPEVIELDIKAQLQLHKIVYDPSVKGV